MFKCKLLKQCSAKHNLLWKYNLARVLRENGFEETGDFVFEDATHTKVIIEEHPQYFVVITNVLPEPSITSVIDSIYNKSTGVWRPDNPKMYEDIQKLVIENKYREIDVGRENTEKADDKYYRTDYSASDMLVATAALQGALSLNDSKDKGTSDIIIKAVNDVLETGGYSEQLNWHLLKLVEYINSCKHGVDSYPRGQMFREMVDVFEKKCNSDLSSSRLNANLDKVILGEQSNIALKNRRKKLETSSLTEISEDPAPEIRSIIDNVSECTPIIDRKQGTRDIMLYPVGERLTQESVNVYLRDNYDKFMEGKSLFEDAVLYLTPRHNQMIKIGVSLTVANNILVVEVWLRRTKHSKEVESHFPEQGEDRNLDNSGIFSTIKYDLLQAYKFEDAAAYGISTDPLQSEEVH